MTKFNTYSDALVFVQNSFSPDFEWGGEASAEGLASYLYLHNPDASAYLRYVGENPADYGLPEPAPERSPARFELTDFDIDHASIQLAVHDVANNEYSWLHVSNSGYVDSLDPFCSRDESSNDHRFVDDARVAAVEWFCAEFADEIDGEGDVCALSLAKKTGLCGR